MSYISRIISISITSFLFFSFLPLKSENQTDICDKSPLLSFILKSIEEFDQLKTTIYPVLNMMISLIPEDSLFISTKDHGVKTKFV